MINIIHLLQFNRDSWNKIGTMRVIFIVLQISLNLKVLNVLTASCCSPKLCRYQFGGHIACGNSEVEKS